MKNICISVVSSRLGLSIGEKFVNEILGLNMEGDYELVGVIHDGNINTAPDCIVHLLLVATGGTEHIVAEIAKRSNLLYLLYTDKYNSLPATVEVLAYLRKHGFKVLARKLYHVSDLRALLPSLERAVKAYLGIKEGCFGVIGGVSPWLVSSRVDPEQVEKKRFGKLVYIPLEELYEAFDEVSVDSGEVENLLRKAHRIDLANPILEVSRSLRVYKAVMKLVEKHKLTGLTLKCFDLISDLGTTGCLAVALLNTMGFPAACEGDVPLLYTMSIGVLATGKPVFMANLADVGDDEVVLAHCTSYFQEKYSLYTHFESNVGVGVRVEYPAGSKATLFRLTSDLSKLRVGVGDIVEHDWKPYMCRTQVKLKLRSAHRLIQDSIGNHYAMVLGDHLEDLRVTSILLDLDVELL